jgi:uracil-DNA glycosylase
LTARRPRKAAGAAPAVAVVESPQPHSDATIEALAAEAARCRRCPLYKDATQVVFGEGPANASVMLVGEQPGDQEDLAGHPFVGPAGRILDRALAEAGLDRGAAFVTNAVKHFKHELRGKRRLHKKPNQAEVHACRWWFEREVAVVRPRLVVALGATAAKALARRDVVLTRERGRVFAIPDDLLMLATIHPSAVLRMPDDKARHEAFAGLVADLRRAVEFIAGRGTVKPTQDPHPAPPGRRAKKTAISTRPR